MTVPLNPPVFAPYSQTYAAREPYITPAEYLASPTGMSTSDIVPGGDAITNADALRQTIARASSWADEICDQILAATMETEVGTWQVRNGMIMVPVTQTPVIAVYGISTGPIATMTLLADYSGVEIGRTVVRVPSGMLTAPTRTSITYVAGFANSIMTATSTAGATVLALDNPLGMIAGQTVTIYDPSQTETIVIASVTATGITTLAPMKFAHAIGVNVSALPARAKQAVVLLTTSLLKTKAAQAMVLHSVRATPQTQQSTAPGRTSEEVDARELLRSMNRVM